MAESEEKTSKSDEENNQEASDKEDENKTVLSKSNLIDPYTKSDNMKDLKSLDFNSADDVRQSLKAVFTSKMPSFIENAEDYIGLNKNSGNDLLRNDPQGSSLLSDTRDKLKNDEKSNILQAKKSMELRLNKPEIRKRRGRPNTNTGISKKIKRQSISSMYIGKLSNIVFSKRGNESDSDIDSILF